MENKPEQNIIIHNTNTQNNNGCLSGCGNLIGIFVAIGLIGALAGQYGVIVFGVAGLIFGAWAGLKIDIQLSGSSLTAQESLEQINFDWEKWSDLTPQEKNRMYWCFGGMIVGLLGGLAMGSAT